MRYVVKRVFSLPGVKIRSNMKPHYNDNLTEMERCIRRLDQLTKRLNDLRGAKQS